MTIPAEEALASWQRLQALREDLRQAETREAVARGEYRAARLLTRQAREALLRALDVETEPLPLFDRPRQAEAEAPLLSLEETLAAGAELDEEEGASPPTAARGEAVPVPLTPEGEGHTHLADLEVRDQKAALWRLESGPLVVLFDVDRFGNWHDPHLPAEDYWPTCEEIAVAAHHACPDAGEAVDWGPHRHLDTHLFEVRLKSLGERAGHFRMSPDARPGSPGYAQARDQLATYPEWWGAADDETGRLERVMLGHRSRGVPETARDVQVRSLITSWRLRQESDPAPQWGRWSEWSWGEGDEKVTALYQPTGLPDLGLYGPSVSETGYRAWLLDEMRPHQDEPLGDYARRVVEHLREAKKAPKARKPRAKKGGAK